MFHCRVIETAVIALPFAGEVCEIAAGVVNLYAVDHAEVSREL